MKIRIFKKLLSFTLSVACALVCLPASSTFATSKSSLPGDRLPHRVLYTNDFEGGGDLPVNSQPPYQIEPVGTGHALFFTKALSESKNEFNEEELYADFAIPPYQGLINGDTAVDFDVVLPGHKANFAGQILGNFDFYDDGEWEPAEEWGSSVKASDFKDLGNGYCSAHMSVLIHDMTGAKNMTQLRIDIGGTVDGSVATDYSGIIGIDNIVFTL